MESPEDFMRRYFAARTAEFKRELEARVPFRKEFYSEDCHFDSRSMSVEQSEREVLMEVSRLGNEVHVITRPMEPQPQRRYRLLASGQSWMIQGVEVFYDGKGWMSSQRMKEELQVMKLRLGRKTPPSESTRN